MSNDKNEEFKNLIKDLRIRMEKTAQELKELENKGTEDDATRALWIAHGAWTGEEYSKIEVELRKKGYKSRSGI